MPPPTLSFFLHSYPQLWNSLDSYFSTTSTINLQDHVTMFRTSFGFEMLHKARRRARLKALRKKKEKKLARYHAHLNKM